MDVILKEGIDLLNEIGAKQSTSEEIKALMQQGVTANVVKSIQHCTMELNGDTQAGSVTINKVDPHKATIIQTGSLYSGTRYGSFSSDFYDVQLVLSADGSAVSGAKFAREGNVTVAFDVVEYY